MVAKRIKFIRCSLSLKRTIPLKMNKQALRKLNYETPENVDRYVYLNVLRIKILFKLRYYKKRWSLGFIFFLLMVFDQRAIEVCDHCC